MIAFTWNPTFYKRFVESYETSRKASLVETDAGFGYIKTMFQSGSHHPLACELLGTQLAKWFGLPTLDFAILELQEDDEIPLGRDGVEMAMPGPAFVTRKVGGNEWDGSAESLDKVENTDIITNLVVFDTWTRNWDRCPPDGDTRRINYGNVFLTSERTSSSDKWRLLAIDHTECFSEGRDLSPQVKYIDKVKDERIYGLFEPFKKYIHRELIEVAAARLSEIDEATVSDYIASIPSKWEIETNTRVALAEFVCNRATFLAENIVEILSSAKYSCYLV